MQVICRQLGGHLPIRWKWAIRFLSPLALLTEVPEEVPGGQMVANGVGRMGAGEFWGKCWKNIGKNKEMY